MVEGDVVQDLVAVVPRIERPVTGVVIQHGQVTILIGQGNVNILISGRVGGEGVIDLGASRISISDVKRPADHEGLASAAFRVVGGPATDDLQSVGV